MALTSNGLDKSHLLQHKKRLINAYGYKAWQLVLNLIEAEGLGYSNFGGNWENLVEQQKLCEPTTSDQVKDFKVFGQDMYAPSSVRLIEDFSHHKWMSRIPQLDSLVEGGTAVCHQDEEADFAYLSTIAAKLDSVPPYRRASAEAELRKEASGCNFVRQNTGRAGWLEIRDGFYWSRWAVLEGTRLTLYKKPEHHASGKSWKEQYTLSDFSFQVEKSSSKECVFLLTALPESGAEPTVRLRVKIEEKDGWEEVLRTRCVAGGGSCVEAHDLNQEILLPYIVVFIGGVTQSELKAIRELSYGAGRRQRQYIVITTCVTSGNKILKSLQADFDSDRSTGLF